MVALEAWALGKPVLANGRCDVLKGQCLRSNAGLYYESYAEFAEALYAITSSASLSAGARPQRRGVLPAALRVAGDRAEVPRRCSSRLSRESGDGRRAGDGAAARLLRPPGSHGAGGRGRARPRSGRGGAGHERRRGPPGARHARLRRRDRPRGARHPARAARGRLRLGDLRGDRGPAARGPDVRLSRSGRREPSGQPAAPPFLDRIARVTSRLRAARPDGAHLPQHHAAASTSSACTTAGGAVLEGTPRAGRLRRPRATWRSAIRSSTAQELEALGFPRTGVLPVVPDFSHLDAAARLRTSPARSTTSGRTCCSWAASSRTSGSRT